jgi:hypothetical protein
VTSCCKNLRVQAYISAAAHRDQLNDLPVTDIAHRNLSGKLAEVQAGDVVSYLEDIVHVVRDEDDAETAVGKASNEIENLLGLGYTESRSRLIEDHELGVPEHGASDGHCLALATRQTRHLLANRLQGANRKTCERFGSATLHRDLIEDDALALLATEEL